MCSCAGGGWWWSSACRGGSRGGAERAEVIIRRSRIARKRTGDIAQYPSDPSDIPPAKKPKVTYPAPHQCMEQGHFYVVLGEDIDAPSSSRYKILSLLGQGTFGKVVEAWDRTRKEYCAVKIVRNTPKYTRDAQLEVKYMERINQCDAIGTFAFARISRHFINDKGHMCIVMPKHGKCLLEVIRRNGAMSAAQVAQVAYQLGRALNFLHSRARYIHTDLKPRKHPPRPKPDDNPNQDPYL